MTKTENDDKTLCEWCDYYVETPKGKVCVKDEPDVPKHYICRLFKKSTHRRIAKTCTDCEHVYHTSDRGLICFRLNASVNGRDICDMFSERPERKDANFRMADCCANCKNMKYTVKTETINGFIGPIIKYECGKHGGEVGELTVCDDWEKIE